LEDISCSPELRELFTGNKSHFIRQRKLTLQCLIGIIINMPKRSLSIELRDFFDILADSKSATKGAFSLQRSKLRPVFFQVWNSFLTKGFYTHYAKEVKRWKGFIVLAVDGSTINLPNKKELKERFGTWGNQHGDNSPMARIVQAYDVLNDLTILNTIHPITTSEKAIINGEVDKLLPTSLTLFDRGFPSYELMYLMIQAEQPKHFVIRCMTTFNNEVKLFAKSALNSKIIDLKASPNAIAGLLNKGFIITDSTHIKVRMVKVKLCTGETELLLTNLYDETLYTIADLNHLYNLRWGIETSYGMQKNQLQLEQFSGHRVICIEQDLHASVFVANLQSLINKQCADYLKTINTKRKHDYKINRNVSWAALKNNIVKFFFEDNPYELLIKLQLVFQQNLEAIRPGRKNKRTQKVRFRRGKYRTLTNYKRAI
jgi:Transposase DDE domain